MLYVYWTCFLVGAPLLVVQFLLSLLGFGHHHHDAGGDHDVHVSLVSLDDLERHLDSIPD